MPPVPAVTCIWPDASCAWVSPVLGHATHWPIFRAGEELMTFQGRFNRCMEQMRAAPYGYDSVEWNDLSTSFLPLQRFAAPIVGVPEVAPGGLQSPKFTFALSHA